MRHIIRSTLATLLLAAAMACGGGGGAATEGDPNAVPVQGSGGGEEDSASSASAGTAGNGDPCDFGGATHMTCQGGLVCCYPEQGEVEYGTCTASCPGYD